MASAAEETRPLVGPAQDAKEAEARKARIGGRTRAPRRGRVPFQARIKAGEVYYTTFDLGAAAAAKEEARRFQELMYPPGCVIHVPGDGHEEEAMRAQAKLMSQRPAPPLRPAGRVCGWLPISSTFPRPDPEPIPVDEPLDFLQLHWLQEERRRATEPGHFEQLAIDRQLVMDCLRHYNSLHPGDEYLPAAGKVTRQYHMDNGICWIHGNFVARRKRSACFSFLPGPRTLFFYELASTKGFDGVVTCTPLDEPVTEAPSVLGFRVWWCTRRNGRLDCICKTCHRRLDVTHPDLSRTFACGHKEVERVCKMCYLRSNVLHPPPGEFAFGHHDPYYGLLSTGSRLS